MEKISADLVKIVTACANTKNEIKDGVKETKWLTAELNRAVKSWEATPTSVKKKAATTMSLSKGTQAGRSDIEKRSADAGTQTVETVVETEQERICREESIIAEDIRNKLQTAQCGEELETILERKWPECTFKKVEVEVGNPLRAEVEGDIAVMIDDPLMNKGISKQLKDRYPELVEIDSLDEEHQGITYITSMTKVPEGKTFKTRERYIFKIALTEIAGEKGNPGGMVVAAKKLMNLAQEYQRKTIRVPIPDNQPAEVARKVLEYVFASSNINVIMHIPRKQETGATSARAENSTRVAKSSRVSDVIIVRGKEPMLSS